MVTTHAVWFSSRCWSEVKCRQGGRVSARRLQSEYIHMLRPSVRTLIHPAFNFQPAATREPDGLCGNKRYRRELLMMGIMVPETC